MMSSGAPSTVGILGMGYVGLPLALQAAKHYKRVWGFDIDRAKIEALKTAVTSVEDVELSDLRTSLQNQTFAPTADFAHLAECDIIVICVPTPLRVSRDPDTTFIEAAVKEILPRLKPQATVILESTTYPGTTRDLVAKPVEALGRVVGKDVFVGFSPERIDPGNKKFGVLNTPKVIGGLTPTCRDKMQSFYSQFIKTVVAVDSAEEAELVKLLENTFRSVNIALANEFALLADRMDIDIWNVINAAATKPFGFMPFYPGPGIGGHCIPLDPAYLSWRAKSYNFFARFIETAMDINGNMPRAVTEKLVRKLNQRGTCLKGAKICIGGLAYKTGISDTRESPAFSIIEELSRVYYADVYAVDPLIDDSQPLHTSAKFQKISVEEIERQNLKFDAFVLVTPHADVPWHKVASRSGLIFDTRSGAPNLRELPGYFKL